MRWNLLKLGIIGLGGFIGAIARYTLSGVAQQMFNTSFPIGTLFVNILGCILLGSIMTLVQDYSYFTPSIRLFITVGILGALTTFSTFGYETVELFLAQETYLAILNIIGNVVLGILSVWLGSSLIRLIAK